MWLGRNFNGASCPFSGASHLVTLPDIPDYVFVIIDGPAFINHYQPEYVIYV